MFMISSGARRADYGARGAEFTQVRVSSIPVNLARPACATAPALHDEHLGLGPAPRPHRVRRLLARRSRGVRQGRWAHEDGRRGAARSRASLGNGGGTPEMTRIGVPSGTRRGMVSQKGIAEGLRPFLSIDKRVFERCPER